MEIHKRSSWLLLLLGISLLATTLQGVQGEAEQGPSESECRPYIEKALKELETGEKGSVEDQAEDSKEDIPTVEVTIDDSDQPESVEDDTHEEKGADESEKDEADDTSTDTEDKVETGEESKEATETDASPEEEGDEKKDADDDTASEEAGDKDTTSQENQESGEGEQDGDGDKSAEGGPESVEDEQQHSAEGAQPESAEDDKQASVEEKEDQEEGESLGEGDQQSVEDKEGSTEDDQTKEDDKDEAEDSKQEEDKDSKEEAASAEAVGSVEDKEDDAKDNKDSEEAKADTASTEDDGKSQEGDAKDSKEETEEAQSDQPAESKEDDKDSKEDDKKDAASDEMTVENEKEDKDDEEDDDKEGSEGESGEAPEEELTLEIEIPSEIRPRDHVEQLLKLDEESSETENIINRISDITLRELKKIYENAIKPLEVLYKYRDLSNRHFGDPEIFSKPLILFMGPWSGGKSSIINYLLDVEYNETSLRTGAEPSPAYFNILMHGDEYEVIDGTQLAADFTFSGLQKFGQGLEERLRGIKLPTKLLDKVNIVEIPGILEVRKQVSRVFPFNDACQWFIDRADIIFLVYDPSKLDVGPETEAILDQLKGREHQTRIVLNKADQVKPEELMRVQGALIWNISPLMSSAQPPIMYTTSLWSRPYEPWAPVRLLQAQERAFLRDLRSAIDKRIENKISSARRFAVRVRNHAKMVDCYLTTYYNHKSVFGNKKQVANEIIEHPQDYHIYEGLSTLTNISRYDLPDPEVYRDFFKLNPLYEFQQLSATCTYFRGCPINRLDVAIAYDLPELSGKHKRLVESALAEAQGQTAPGS